MRALKQETKLFIRQWYYNTKRV